MTNFKIIHSVLCFMTCFFGDFASRLCQGWVIVCRTVRLLVHSPDRPSSWWSGSRLLHRPSLVAVCLPVHYETCMVHCLPFGLYRETVKQPIHVEVAPTRLGQSCRFGSHRLSWSPPGDEIGSLPAVCVSSHELGYTVRSRYSTTNSIEHYHNRLHCYFQGKPHSCFTCVITGISISGIWK